jgi:phospholipid/cholesterol/gamma-HCH transport system substrate-binding protein
MRAVTDDAAGTARALRATSETARDAVRDFAGPDGAGSRVTQSMRNTLAAIEEVTNDLSEGTEALKRNFLFRGFFRRRGFYDLDSISRDAYQAGLLERDRTAVRIWLEGGLLFDRDRDGQLRLTADGRRRVEVAMGQLVQYPRDSPLVVEGYAQATDGDTAYLLAAEHATIVREHLLSRFRRVTTLTDIMPMGREAVGSPRADGTWEGVALTMFVSNDVFRGRR